MVSTLAIAKLELNWIGKNEGLALIRDDVTGRPQQVPYSEIQPRILVQDLEYGDAGSDNILIAGENLFALTTLLRSGYEGCVNVVYIDPPFNTGQAFDDYDDNLEHSLWLTLMRDRIALLYDLLHELGTLFVHIDDTNLGYLLAILDEKFGSKNRLAVVTFKQGAATGHKSINPGVVTTSNFVVIYAKNKARTKYNRLFTARQRDKRYSQFIVNRTDHHTKWKFVTLSKAFAETPAQAQHPAKKGSLEYEKQLDAFVLANPESIVQFARPDYDGVSAAARQLIDKSEEQPNKIMRLARNGHSDLYLKSGKRILFYSDKLKVIDGESVAGEPLTTIWDDLLSNNLHNEGGVTFPKGKKPEALIKRILDLASSPNDLILDCFAGSGTTGAVAHKMNRRWIMIDKPDNVRTHIIPRLQRVVDGDDSSGVTGATSWTHGGGFRAYALGKALVERDAMTGVWRLNYTNGKLIEAVCLNERFTLCADGIKHGIKGRHYAHVTDQYVSKAVIEFLSREMDDGETLTVYCTKHASRIPLPDYVEIKRIPKALLQGRIG